MKYKYIAPGIGIFLGPEHFHIPIQKGSVETLISDRS